MSSNFKPLKKGDLVVSSGYKPGQPWSLENRGFVLGEISKGSCSAWRSCHVYILIQKSDWYYTGGSFGIHASNLRKVELYKVKKKREKPKAI